jgi:DNA-binding MarR family transcriptional regulator
MTGTINAVGAMQTERELRSLPLPELIRHWSRLVWATSVRPMYRRLMEHDLSLAELVVLRQMQRGSLTVAAVAECLNLSPSAASRAIDRLVRDGLIRREENPDDRRQKLITMTEAGQRLVGEMEAIFAEQQRRIVATLDEEEQAQFSGLLARMLAAHRVEGEAAGCPMGAAWGQMSREMARDDD